MVLGISGGIDSTLTAAICHEVEKRTGIPLYGVSLPCNSNAKDENASALATLSAFCQPENASVVNLEDCYQAVLGTCECCAHESTPISKGNIKARLRMIYLYNLAGVTGGLVMDTDNLTEHYLGFFTIHGDVADFNPIGGLWKHEVFEMVRWLRDYYPSESLANIALTHALIITPTDGNGVQAGGDMAQIAPGHTYEEVDEILQSIIDKDHPIPTEIDEPDLIQRVMSRHEKSEFKRGRMPKVIKRELYT